MFASHRRGSATEINKYNISTTESRRRDETLKDDKDLAQLTGAVLLARGRSTRSGTFGVQVPSTPPV